MKQDPIEQVFKEHARDLRIANGAKMKLIDSISFRRAALSLLDKLGVTYESGKK